MNKDGQEAFETFEFELPPIRGFPELRWAGKRPFKSTHYFPAQKKESYGDPTDGWWNRIYWGDNLQVMSHLLREFRGKIDLIYIDPPFDSKAEYKKTVSMRGMDIANDHSAFEEKQYSDIWDGDQYLQFMHDRLVIMKELLKDGGSLYIHCDWHKVHQLRSVAEEIFGPSAFCNEIIWRYRRWSGKSDVFQKMHDDILFFRKGSAKPDWNEQRERYSEKTIHRAMSVDGITPLVQDEAKGVAMSDVWNSTDDVLEVSYVHSQGYERVGYPTQKPEELLRIIIEASSDEGGIVFDPFMGSGTTQAVSMKIGRRFIGADVNLGAVETTAKRLNNIRGEIEESGKTLFADDGPKYQGKIYPGFEIYNVNNYDLFRNPVEAKELIREAMELQPLPSGSVFDGQREGYLVKIMPVNRISTRQDLNEVINGLDFKAFERRKAATPNKSVESIHLVCMGHEPDLGSHLILEAKKSGFDIDVMVTDLIRDKAHLHFKKSSDARLSIEKGNLVVKGFYPMNLLQKLSLESSSVKDWRQLVESVKVDFHYDGAVLTPAIVDTPGKDGLVSGRYPIPEDAATIRVKITDLLSESWEGEIENG